MSADLFDSLVHAFERLESTAPTIGRPAFFCNKRTAKFLMRQTRWFDHLARQAKPPAPRKHRGPRLRSRAKRPSAVKAQYRWAAEHAPAETPRYYTVKVLP